MNYSGAIINSNCASHSNREGVLAQLGTMMQVDVFGKCGKPAPIPQDVSSKAGHFGEAYDILGKTYPFLFSFENSLCDDYVSERFFIIMSANVIPVVYNGANMSTIAPKHSYIDIKDFANLQGKSKLFLEFSHQFHLFRGSKLPSSGVLRPCTLLIIFLVERLLPVRCQHNLLQDFCKGKLIFLN